MSVKSAEKDIRVLNTAFEARYEEGFRFLDHSGALLVAIRKTNPKWAVTKAGYVANLQYENASLLAKIDTSSLVVTGPPASDLDDVAGQAHVRVLAEQSELLYEILVSVIPVPTTIRVGARFTYVVPADSPEDADRFVSKAIACNATDKVRALTGAEVVEQDLKITIEEASGYRRHVRFMSLAKGEAHQPDYHGFPVEGLVGYVGIDMDTFTRPAEGHFPNAARFINDCYNKTINQARELFQWLRSQQK